MDNFRKLLTVILVIEFVSCFSIITVAQDNSFRKKFYVGMTTGIGGLKLTGIDFSKRNTCFSLGFNAGVTPFEWLKTGINLNGWLVESYGNFYDDPSRGISISNFFGELEAFPFEKINLSVKLAGGFSKYINRHPDEFNRNGAGAIAGVGYEWHLKGRMSVALKTNIGFGRFNEVKNVLASIGHRHYRITEIVVGFVYR